MRRAKIAATLGPACGGPATLRRMVAAGLDVARINFSHGTAAEHRRRVRALRDAAARAGRPVALLADLQGPRFRVGSFAGGSATVKTGSEVDLIAGREHAEPGKIPVAFRAFSRLVQPGDQVLLDDGTIEFEVLSRRGSRVRCRTVRGGTIRDHKGINIPGGRLTAQALTAKDRRDLRLAVSLGADWLAVSFVRGAGDVEKARRLLRRAGRAIPVMAKIERPEAIENLDAILQAADGLMVARGDLGVEFPPERVPVLQKRIIEAAARAGKPVVTATQMLESMRHSPRPTRAEASDVANAVLDGSSCLLLTAETASGSYPAESVAMMARIVEEAEGSGRAFRPSLPEGKLSVPEAAALAASRAAAEVGARAVVVFTQSGSSARAVARFRPTAPILAFTPLRSTLHALAIEWGVTARLVEPHRSTDALLRALDRALIRLRLASRGDVVVVLSGSPVGVPGTTNLVKIHRLGGAVRSGRLD